MRQSIVSLPLMLACCFALSACNLLKKDRPSNTPPPDTTSAQITPSQTDVPPAKPDPATPDLPALWQPTQDGASLRHIASGYVCPAGLAGFERIGEETYPGLGRGNDVACVYEAVEGGAIKLHVTNFGRAVSIAAHLKGVQTIIRDTFKVQGTTPLPHIPNAPSRIEAFSLKIAAISNLRPDVPVHTAVWIEEFAPWHVKVRATYEADRGPAVGVLVEALFASARKTINPPERLVLPPGIEPLSSQD